MKSFPTLLLLMVGCSAPSAPPVPMPSGDYEFAHRFAEHPTMASITLNVRIAGAHVVVVNATDSDVFPAGVLDEGVLMWHAASKQWIVGHEKGDDTLPDVGGCSDGPAVIDLVNRIYWTC
jgi:hypothetical protein